ncbi:MAG: serine/threonine protein kinase [Planctomycetota bacterium]|nr:MAG: serine/threonine protein kinase [Planctomycetota bacterium]
MASSPRAAEGFVELRPAPVEAVRGNDSWAQRETVTLGEAPSAPGGVRSRTWRVGDVFAGRYQLTAMLGEGGMGTVYAAWDRRGRRPVALKLARPGSTGRLEGARLARLVREGQLGQRLRHRNLVPVLDAGQCGTEPFVVFAFVPGARPLPAVARDLGWRECLRLMRDVADGLAHAHARGVVHRDVKPENVLVGAGGRAWLVDFGLATACDLPRITADGARLGTPPCMAPESIAEGRYGPPVDVWGLGVTLYWLLTGVLPFRAASPTELVREILERDPDPPGRLGARVPRRLERLCLRALAKRPEDRYPDAAAFRDAVETCLLARRSQRSRRVSRKGLRWASGGVLFAAGVLLAICCWLACSTA